MQSILESRLAAVLMGELFPRQDLDDTYVDIILDDFDLDDDYYAAFELVFDEHATTEFVRVRDTSRDHIVTVKFPREAVDGDTQPMPLYSAPYERIETSFENALPFPLYSAPFERVDLDIVVAPPTWPDESTDIIAAPRTAARVIATLVILAGALLLGLGLVMFAM
jgi:hypothetical protein